MIHIGTTLQITYSMLLSGELNFDQIIARLVSNLSGSGYAIRLRICETHLRPWSVNMIPMQINLTCEPAFGLFYIDFNGIYKRMQFSLHKRIKIPVYFLKN